jgi:hypothetical protein
MKIHLHLHLHLHAGTSAKAFAVRSVGVVRSVGGSHPLTDPRPPYTYCLACQAMYIVADIDVEASSFGPAYGPGVACTLIQHPFTVGTCAGGGTNSELNARSPPPLHGMQGTRCAVHCVPQVPARA